MCLAVPGKIVDITSPLHTGRLATVDFEGSRVEASLAAVPDAKLGDWVLVHAGFALTVLDEAEARETFEALQLALDDAPEPATSEG
jgi:hydrogenase expression/formation protein HypC